MIRFRFLWNESLEMHLVMMALASAQNIQNLNVIFPLDFECNLQSNGIRFSILDFRAVLVELLESPREGNLIVAAFFQLVAKSKSRFFSCVCPLRRRLHITL